MSYIESYYVLDDLASRFNADRRDVGGLLPLNVDWDIAPDDMASETVDASENACSPSEVGGSKLCKIV